MRNRRDYEQGYADRHADGFTKGSLAARLRVPDKTPLDNSPPIVNALYSSGPRQHDPSMRPRLYDDMP
jgi:hypothetical protein